MLRPSRPILLSTLLALAMLATLDAARAQEVCRTPNCAAPGTVPAECARRAAPRTPMVLMTTQGLNFMFEPSEPRIEPGDCVEWMAATVTHSSSDGSCPDDGLCGSPSPAACMWDSGNVSSGAVNPSVVCHYDPADFPAATGDAFYCRIHASPTTGTMRGTMRVTTEIVLTVDKDGNDVLLSWTGGGLPGDETFKVERSDSGDPTFPAAGTTTFDPDGGVTGRTRRDVGELTNSLDRFYLVRNKQTNE